MKNPSWITEFKGLYETLKNEWWIIFLFPFFFSSNIFYTYQGSMCPLANYCASEPDLTPSRWFQRLSLQHQDPCPEQCAVLDRAGKGIFPVPIPLTLADIVRQIIGAVITGFTLDFMKARRSIKAKVSYVFLVVLTFVIWGGGWAWQKQQVSRARTEEEDWEDFKVDWTDDGYVGPLFMYFFVSVSANLYKTFAVSLTSYSTDVCFYTMAPIDAQEIYTDSHSQSSTHATRPAPTGTLVPSATVSLL